MEESKRHALDDGIEKDGGDVSVLIHGVPTTLEARQDRVARGCIFGSIETLEVEVEFTKCEKNEVKPTMRRLHHIACDGEGLQVILVPRVSAQN